MNHATLSRFCYSPEGTFGHLTLPSGLVLATVERPWLDNKTMVSCIPVGNYQCSPRRFYRGGYDAVEIKDVPGRSHILFHIGNYVRNFNGCVGLNSQHGARGNEWCGWGSTAAFEAFMEELGQETFELSIINF